MATAAHLSDSSMFTVSTPRADVIIPGNAMERVLGALENPAYRWHTVSGIATEIDLSPAIVRFVLSEIPADDLVATPSPNGYLYTTRRHYNSTKTLKSRILSVLSDLPK